MATIISIINDKGGVAKTTTAANLGTALWLLGKKVLLVDTDMQCNLTVTLDRTAINTDENLMTWLMGPKEAEPPTYERYDGLDYIPSSQNANTLENNLRERPGGDRQLDMRLKFISHHYDYIIIDCAPGCTSMLNTNVLEASNYVIVPIRPDLFSVTGRGMLLRHIESIRDLNYDIKIMGALLTQFDPRTSMGKRVKEFYKTSSDIPLIPVHIRKCEELNKSIMSQQTVYEYAPGCNAADEYMMLAEYIVSKIEGKQFVRKKGWTPEVWGKKASEAFDGFIKRQNEE